MKSIFLQEMARTMLSDHSTLKHLWAEPINIVYYLQNKIYIRPILKGILMNCGKDVSPTFLISTHLDGSGCKE